jgi:hypothetical protein
VPFELASIGTLAQIFNNIPLLIGGILLAVILSSALGAFLFMSLGILFYNTLVVHLVGGLKVDIRLREAATGA